mmetsp:Transcript_16448/g.35739  ORF Transcript_16448/g.35739 Transcript_16448/m.35739 type:complete len:130 (-) Transcript_16448:46-435(-)
MQERSDSTNTDDELLDCCRSCFFLKLLTRTRVCVVCDPTLLPRSRETLSAVKLCPIRVSDDRELFLDGPQYYATRYPLQNDDKLVGYVSKGLLSNKRRLTILVFFLYLSGLSLFNRWEECNGEEGGTGT